MTANLSRKNIEPLPFPDLEALGDDPDAVGRAVATWAERYVEEAIAWYLQRKKLKARWSRYLRLTAICMTAAGGIWPLAIAAMNVDKNNAGAGYIFLGVAAAAVGLDKFFGMSSAWMRYIATQLKIQRRLQAFQLERTKIRTEEGRADVRLHLLIDAVERVLAEVNVLMQEETLQWSSEFEGSLRDLQSNGLRDLQAR